MTGIRPEIVLAQLILQVRIISAVARRELQLRAAKGVLGLAGVFAGPLLLIFVILAIRLFIRVLISAYMNPILWLSVGIVPFFAFVEIAIKAINGVKKNSDLLFYRRLRPLDSLMGNALLLAQIFGILMLVFLVIISAWEWRLVVQDLGTFIMIFLGMILMGFGVGISTLIVGHRLPIIGWLIQNLLRRVLLFTSCCFYSITFFPEVVRPWILWNPLAHGIELMRAACNPAYPIPGISASYFWIFVVGSIGFGLVVYGNNEELLYADEASIALLAVDDDGK